MGSDDITRAAAAYAIPLAVAFATMLAAGATTDAGSTTSLPVSAKTLELVAASPQCDGPPTSAMVPAPPEAEADASSELGGRRALSHDPTGRVTPLPFFFA